MAAIAVIRDGGPGLSTGAAPELRRFSFVSSSPFDDVELRRRSRSLDPGPPRFDGYRAAEFGIGGVRAASA
ncbi:MAG: hypothetical protein KGQ48_06050 [Bradyrhizobium sp.]|nr:hypothetical protein [Bradyrhizobium sp.]